MTFPPPVPGGPVPPSGQLPPPAFVDLTVQGSAMSASLVPPRVTINGWPVQDAYGRRVLPVAPGYVRVEAQAQWWRTYGRASLDFVAAPGQTVPVFYSSPFTVFSDGSMGHVKQRRRGAIGLWITFGVLALMVGLIVVAAIQAA
jgi:hypothetical protein